LSRTGLGAGRVQLLDVGLVHLQSRSRDQFIQLFYAGCARNRGSDARPRDLPGERNARRRSTMTPADIVQRREDFQAARIEELVDHAFAARAFGGVRGRAVLPAQETGSECEIGDDANLLLETKRLEFGFVIGARIKIVVRLQNLITRQGAFAANLERLRNPSGGVV
jgi:hypothetical protein